MIRKQFATPSARRLIGLCGCLTVLAVAVVAPHACASPVIVDSHGFETPFFTTTAGGTGSIEGQTPATFNGTWLRDKGVGSSTAIVQTAVVDSGTQAVQVTKAANEVEASWAVPVDGYPTSGYICIDWSMRVQGPAGDVNTKLGPFFGVRAYDDDTIPLGLLGSLGVDATTGEVLYQAAGTGDLTPAGPTVAFGAWNDYGIELNYFTHSYRFLLNGSQIGGPIGFVDNGMVVGGLNSFNDANITAANAAAGSLAQLTGTAYFDNFRIEDGPCVPEPSTIALAGIGACGIWVGCRRGQRRVG